MGNETAKVFINQGNRGDSSIINEGPFLKLNGEQVHFQTRLKEEVMSILSLHVKDNIATLTINSRLANALSTALIEELNQQLNAISKEPAAKAVIIKGEGRFFSAGADIKEFTQVESAEGQSDLSRNEIGRAHV